MEWVVTTGKTIAEAKDRALDQLGVASDEAEFEIVEEPRTGLFGRLKAEARVRARVKPTQVRPKHDRRDRRRGRAKRGDKRGEQGGDKVSQGADRGSRGERTTAAERGDDRNRKDSPTSSSAGKTGARRQRSKQPRQPKEQSAMQDGTEDQEVSPQEVGDAAVAFVTGLAEAFGADATAEIDIDGTDLDVRLAGAELGLLVGPGGRTLTAVQDLARVAAQRRLGDHETRLRIDVGGYREKRRAALEQFAVAVAKEVATQGSAKALEPMSSADRKVVHDAIADVEGVASRSDGEEPNRRVVISPS